MAAWMKRGGSRLLVWCGQKYLDSTIADRPLHLLHICRQSILSVHTRDAIKSYLLTTKNQGKKLVPRPLKRHY